MIDQLPQRKYCFDTSAFINGWRLHYKPQTFAALRDHIGTLMENRSVVVPEEVEKEIGAGTDDLVIWFKPHRKCVLPISEDQLAIVSEIVNKYPLVSQYKKPKPYSADPFVVAVAKLEGRVVVTYEKENKSSQNPNIPDLCKEHRVECCDLASFFEKEGITFGIV